MTDTWEVARVVNGHTYYHKIKIGFAPDISRDEVKIILFIDDEVEGVYSSLSEALSSILSYFDNELL